MSSLVRIGDILRLERRETPIGLESQYTEIGVRSFGKGIFHYPSKSGADLNAPRYFLVRPRDLVISNIQAWEGAIAFAGPEEDGCIGNHRMLTYVPIDYGDCDTSYLRYFFLSQQGMTLIQRASPGTVTRNRTLGKDRFANLQIPLPDLPEQQRVVAQMAEIETVLERIRATAKLADAFEASALDHVVNAVSGT